MKVDNLLACWPQIVDICLHGSNKAETNVPKQKLGAADYRSGGIIPCSKMYNLLRVKDKNLILKIFYKDGACP